MIPSRPCLKLGRVTLETLSPLSIGAGPGIGLFDTTLVRDANGLPAIPASSLTGALRHLYAQYFGEKEAGRLFGFEEKGNKEGLASCLEISWGAIHDSDDRPVTGLLIGDQFRRLREDPLLVLACQDQPLKRDYVRLGHRGTGLDGLLFDRAMLPVGYRFTVELGLWSGEPNDERLAKVLGLIDLPEFRLGGSTRSGLGKVKQDTDRCRQLGLDMRRAEDRERFGNLTGDLGDLDGFEEAKVEAIESHALCATVRLKPEDFWRFGGGETPFMKTVKGKSADMMPFSEPVVEWSDGKGRIAERKSLVATGSGVKGALSHRIAFHLNRIAKRYAIEMTLEDWKAATGPDAAHPDVKEIFGSVKHSRKKSGDDGKGKKEPSGQAGRILMDDFLLSDFKTAIMVHNAIDRFTGGVRDGFLFDEELAFEGILEMNMTVLDRDKIPDNARRSLALALADLTSGRLGVGGGSGKGHGYCTGEIDGDDFAAWLEG